LASANRPTTKQFFLKDNIILVVYVDDLLLFGPSKENINKVKQQLNQRFEMTDLGACEFFLGTKVIRDRSRKKLWLSQSSYLKRMLQRLNFQDAKKHHIPMDTGETLGPAPHDHIAAKDLRHEYQSILGSLMFAMVGTRVDLAYPVSKLSRFMTNPTRQHHQAAKRILRYMATTTTLALEFDGTKGVDLKAWTDAEWGKDKSDSISVECFIFTLAGGAVSWKSRKQSVVSISSTESEYLSLFTASLEATFLKGLLEEFGHPADKGMVPILPLRRGVGLRNNWQARRTDLSVHLLTLQRYKS